jgi:hypothetical protein
LVLTEDVALSIINPLLSEEIDEHDKEKEKEEKIDLKDLKQKFSKQIHQKMGECITSHQEKALLTFCR